MDEDILLHCNLCDTSRLYTDELWLRTINGRDYLVCDWHVLTTAAKPETKYDR